MISREDKKVFRIPKGAVTSAINKKKREIKRVLNQKSAEELRQMKKDIEEGSTKLGEKIHATLAPIVLQGIEEILANREGGLK